MSGFSEEDVYAMETYEDRRANGECGICGRKLDTGDLASRDCGGDCLACMAEAGDPDAIRLMEGA